MGFFRKKKKDEQVYLMCEGANERACFKVDNALGAIYLFDEGYPIVVGCYRHGRTYTITISKRELDSRYDDYYFYKDTEILYRRKNRDEYERSVDEVSKAFDDIQYTRTHVNPTPPRDAPVYHPTKTTNLIEIIQKDIHSVPEVWYRGERIGQLPKQGLVDLCVNWHTSDESNPTEQLIRVEYLDNYTDEITLTIDSDEEWIVRKRVIKDETRHSS